MTGSAEKPDRPSMICRACGKQIGHHEASMLAVRRNAGGEREVAIIHTLHRDRFFSQAGGKG